MKALSILFSLAISISLFGQDNCPCCTENHRAFDFWVGSWETTANDKVAGHNIIDIIQDSCIIRENWTSAGSAYTGTSYNFYNSQENRWEQIWLDNQGGSLHLKGNSTENQMILQGDPTPNPKGGTIVNRITWTANEDGTVRQLWEVSPDEGESWKPVFDGLYSKKP